MILPTWSPDGQQIAFYGTQGGYPGGLPYHIPQVLCTMNADGTSAQPLPYTVCRSGCWDGRSWDLQSQVVWLQSEILYLRDGSIFRIAPGSKPVMIARTGTLFFVANPAGTRIAVGQVRCPYCSGPVTILDAQSGDVVGRAGGRKLDNIDPSLSPDGAKVAFERDAYDSGTSFGIWRANKNGSHLRRLAKVGEHPLWSPTGGKIAYVARRTPVLRLISARGGKSRVLVRRNVEKVFGWSPDGKSIAFETGKGFIGKLAVVDVATGKVRKLLQLQGLPTVVWSPDSSELLANSIPGNEKCWFTWRVPADGSRPTLISTCS